MACSNNHENIEPGKFCPVCGERVGRSEAFAQNTSYVADAEYLGAESQPNGATLAKTPKLIALVSIAVSLVLVIAGITANKIGWDNLMAQLTSDIANATSNNSSSNDSSSNSTPYTWAPSGYTEWNSEVAYQFDNSDSCQNDGGNGCFLIRVTPSSSCSAVSGTMDLKDSNGIVVNTASASAGSVESGKYVQLEFDDPDGSASKGSLTSLYCD